MICSRTTNLYLRIYDHESYAINVCSLFAVRPLWVRLQGGKRPLVAGQSTELTCQAVGARPKPTISWWKGGTRLKTVRETVSMICFKSYYIYKRQIWKTW